MKLRGIGLAILAVVFLLGSVAGGAVTYGWMQSDRAANVRAGKSLSKHRLRALSRKLELDREQRARVAAILDSDDTESAAIGRDVVARCGQPLRVHERQVNDEIREVLRPEQRRRFERILDQQRGGRGAMRPL